MFANGPPWMIAGVPSIVCTRFGLTASFNSAAIAPCAFKSRAKIGFRSRVMPMKISPSRFFRSARLSERHRIAMISDAAVMSKPVSRGTPPVVPPRPTVTFRRARSLTSKTRFQTTVLPSMFNDRFRSCKLLSINAASKLCAFSTAAKSPVK